MSTSAITPEASGENNPLLSSAWQSAGDLLKGTNIGSIAGEVANAASTTATAAIGLPSLSSIFSTGNWIAVAIGVILLIAGFALFAGEEVVSAIGEGNVKGAVKAAVL